MSCTTARRETCTVSSVGADIRGLRKRRNMTLAALAARLRRSVGFVSQLERGLSDPSIEDLRNIAQVFDVPVSFFFSNDPPANRHEARHVVRRGVRRRLGNAESALREELLSPDLSGSFETLLCEFAPGTTMETYQQRQTEEAGYVVSGVFELEIDGVWYVLDEGDSFRFAGERYRWRNTGSVAAIIVWVISPPVY